MARLSKETWEKLKADYATGAYSVRNLAKKYNISHAAINKKIKKENWIILDEKELAEVANEKKVIKKVSKSFHEKVSKVSKKVSVKPEKLEKTIEEYVDKKEMIETAGVDVVLKAQEILTDGKVEEIATVSGEMGEIRVVERKLNPRELKSLADAIDKIAQTLGVVPRFSQQVNIQNSNTIENKTLEVKIVKANKNDA